MYKFVIFIISGYATSTSLQIQVLLQAMFHKGIRILKDLSQQQIHHGKF